MVVLILATLLACGKGGKKADPAALSATAEDADLAVMLADYKNNEVRADGKYKDKRVRVTGTVGEVKKDIADSIYVTLGVADEREIPAVQCFVPKSGEAAASALDKGSTVTVTGRVSGLMMNVLVKDCELGASSKPQVKPGGAERVCKKLTADGIATKCKLEPPDDGGPGETSYSFLVGLTPTSVLGAGLVIDFPDDEAFEKAAAKLVGACSNKKEHVIVLMSDSGKSATAKELVCADLALIR